MTGLECLKPLEKVVKALEICGKVDPSLCPYFDTKHWECCTGHIQGYSPVKDDAYSYLREYLDYQKLQKMVKKSDSFLDTDNSPLSWNELKQMEGKPVWVETQWGRELDSEWMVINYLLKFEDGTEALLTSCGLLDQKQQSVIWQAYRKERK